MLGTCVCGPNIGLHVQVLDDSTDVHTRQLVDDKAAEWQERGVAVSVVRRTNRAGYKAGALKEVNTVLSPCRLVEQPGQPNQSLSPLPVLMPSCLWAYCSSLLHNVVACALPGGSE